MVEIIKPVRIGILLGLLDLLFGIGWIFWLTLGHEKVHKSLEEGVKRGQGIIEWLEPHAVSAHIKEKSGEGTGDKGEGMEGMSKGLHESPVMELAHIRLRRGHIHATGLGLLTIAISFILVFTKAPDKLKGVASFLTGLGGLIYPIAWILMGYRTPGLGPEGAELSVRPIAGFGVILILFGILSAGLFLLKDLLAKHRG